MSKTLRSMCIGDVLIFGQYSAKDDGSFPVPIRWLKATPSCDFISECVLDILKLDGTEAWPDGYRPKGWADGLPQITGRDPFAGEARGGDPHFGISTLMQYLNSDCVEWYSPQHKYDAPPERAWAGINNQVRHHGFLKYFEQHEIDALVPKTVDLGTEVFTSKVRIPTEKDIYGGDERLNIFKKRRGVRAHPSKDLSDASRYSQWRTGETGYMSYFLADIFTRYQGYNSIVKKDSYRGFSRTDQDCGVRPLVSLNPDTKIEALGGNEYTILPRGATGMKTSTAAEMFAFFGMKKP